MQLFKRKQEQSQEAPITINWSDFARTARQKLLFTPDMATLQESAFQLMFFYEEIQRDHPKYDLIAGNSAYAYTAFTHTPFHLCHSRLGKETQAFLIEDKLKDIDQAKVRGEIHIVRPPAILKLDEYKANGVQFERKRIRVMIPYHQVVAPDLSSVTTDAEKKAVWGSKNPKVMLQKTAFLDVWTYVAITDHWVPLLDGGYHYKCYNRFHMHTANRKNVGDYFKFTTKDYSG